MDIFLTLFGISLGLTLIIEFLAALCFGLRSRRELTLVVLVNILTNPAAVWLCWGFGIPQIPIEIAVVATEWYVYRNFGIPRPLMFSLAANGASWGLGLVLQML